MAFPFSPSLSSSMVQGKWLHSSGSQFLGIWRGIGLDLGFVDISGWKVLCGVCVGCVVLHIIEGLAACLWLLPTRCR